MDAAVDLGTEAKPLHEGIQFASCQPGPLRGLFLDAGFADIEVTSIVVPTVFRNFDDYWTPFLGG